MKNEEEKANPELNIIPSPVEVAKTKWEAKRLESEKTLGFLAEKLITPDFINQIMWAGTIMILAGMAGELLFKLPQIVNAITIVCGIGLLVVVFFVHRGYEVVDDSDNVIKDKTEPPNGE